MKIGIISVAHMHAYSYISALQRMDDVEIVGIADDEMERGKEAANHFNIDYFSNYEDLLATDVEAVIVTSENIKHVEHVSAAARAKKHVLCEKPLATTIEDGLKMIDICKEHISIIDRKSTRLNSSHVAISYAVFCLKKKKKNMKRK